jgi:hypothetical protein
MRQVQVVPIVHVESFALASSFPICWQDGEARPVLVALRTADTDAAAQPHGPPATPAALPLALRAHPFAVGAKDSTGRRVVSAEHTIAGVQAEPSAPVSPPDLPDRGTQSRLRAAKAFNDALPLTERMTAELYAGDLFAPWRPEFDAGGQAGVLDGLFVVRPAAFDSTELFRFIGRFGSLGAALVGAHRLSLYCASALREPAQPRSPPAAHACAVQ